MIPYTIPIDPSPINTLFFSRLNLNFAMAMTGWWYTYLPLWKIWVSWDDDIPNWMEKKVFQTTNQHGNDDTGGQFQQEPITGWWCNNHLEKYEFVNGKDDIPYMKWRNKIHVPNHQPVVIYHL